jgi:pimeloyl-ACP methyl ester carboxylesterase
VTIPGGLRHRIIDAGRLAVHIVEGGPTGAPVLLFLHGWPESWAIFEPVMLALADDAQVVALDLPGVGESRSLPEAADKHTLAGHVRDVVEALRLREVILIGHDVGGMIAYAYLRAYRGELRRAVIMNVAVPGVEPWSRVVANPMIWHFAFHAVPGLPERLVAGREAAYLDFFFDTIAATPEAVPSDVRRRAVDAYVRPEALRAGFDWYRAFPEDERRNRGRDDEVSTPVLVIRGDREPGKLEDYVRGLRECGLREVRGTLIRDSGHFAPVEQPARVAAALRELIR